MIVHIFLIVVVIPRWPRGWRPVSLFVDAELRLWLVLALHILVIVRARRRNKEVLDDVAVELDDRLFVKIFLKR